MKNESSTFEGREHRELFYQYWLPDSGEVKAYLVALHDWGAHSDRFGVIAKELIGKGYGIYAFDLRGHWRNANKTPGHIDSIDHIKNDLVLFLGHIKPYIGNKKIFLLGHSLGGLIVLRYAVNRPNLDGLIIISPLLAFAVKIPGVKKFLKRLTKAPTDLMPFEIDQKLLTGDLKIVREYLKDKNRLKTMSIKSYAEIDKEMKNIMLDANGILCPIYILQAGDEKVTDKKVTKKFFDKVKSEDKTYKEYPLALHDLMAERNRAEVFQDIYIWLERHLK
ncbi:MAG: alpha/beta fold hydrolase [Promethearchaeota archaeon]